MAEFLAFIHVFLFYEQLLPAMLIFNTVSELQKHLNSVHLQDKIVGLVPTMGALHKGHISLISAAKAQSDVVVASIFVNPTQFNDLNDLANYPKTIVADRKLLKKGGCDLLFAPEINEMYSPLELELKSRQIEDKSWTEGKIVDFENLSKVMEGALRPGHFNGVAQVVSKLFRIVKPNKAFFGQKDFQQVCIIRSMVKQLELPIEIISCPIVRDEDGLAMSSRNIRLTVDERKVAPHISRILLDVYKLRNKKSIAELKLFVETHIASESQMHLDYFEIVNADTLELINNFSEAQTSVACIAVKLGATRLIDNILLTP